ncbi:MAG: IclR family transcriptional regulator [Betaproteobacteria bacterium]|nr:IclR family transcriptional regulator [Betaproteobacteria bacterium]
MPNRPSRPSRPPPADDDGVDHGQRAVQSVEVGGRLLLALAAHRGPMNLKDLAQEAGMTAARAHPYLVSFGRLRLVEQDRPSGRYALGPAALQMGLTALHQQDAVRTAETMAEALAQRTGHAVAVAVWGNFGPTVVRMIEARQPLLISMRAGTVMSLLHTATGRAFAAALPHDRLLQALSGHTRAVGDPPGRSTRPGPNDWAIVEAARKDVRLQGVVRAKGRPIPGVNAFSSPCFNHLGEPAVVITMLDRQEQLTVDWASASARALRDAARDLSTRLGWAGAPADA